MTWVNAVVQGILLGGFYALLACGLALMFGVMRIINLAHGDIAVLGAYLIFVVLDHWNTSPFLALLPVLPVMLRRSATSCSGRCSSAACARACSCRCSTTFGLSIVIQNLLLESFSPDVRSLGGQAGRIATASWQITSELSISAIGALILGVAVADARRPAAVPLADPAGPPDARDGAGSRHRRARRHQLARGLRARDGDRGRDRRGRRACSSRSARRFDPFTGPTQLIFAFEAVVIGGFGSLWGTLAGGIVLGVAQTIGAQINPQYFVLAGPPRVPGRARLAARRHLPAEDGDA